MGAQPLIVSGSILDSLLNGTKYSHNMKGFDEWLAKQDIMGLSELRESVVSALSLVLSDKFELNELWQENEDDYPIWKKNIIVNLRS